MANPFILQAKPRPSVMDYLTMNIPSSGKPVHLFTPVIGAYDKLAIRYGYMESHEDAKETLKEMESLLQDAEQFTVCINGDYSRGQDPLC